MTGGKVKGKNVEVQKVGGGKAKSETVAVTKDVVAEKDEMITNYIVLSSKIVLSNDLIKAIMQSGIKVVSKETCFGIKVSGRREDVDKAVELVKKLDPIGIFAKESGFEPGNHPRCRSSRYGGPKPGFHLLESEIRMLPSISAALEVVESGQYKPQTPEMKERLRKGKIVNFDEFVEIVNDTINKAVADAKSEG